MNPKIKELRKKAMQLPLTPGVYLMKNSSSEIIYVGKAKALKNRVSQYFGSEHNHTVKVRKMVENVDDFDVILTDSEFEALVLECSLIKQHSPKYNILLKDDKGYSYIKVTPGKWRNIYAVLQREDDGAKYIGPYMSSFAARNTVDEAKNIPPAAVQQSIPARLREEPPVPQFLYRPVQRRVQRQGAVFAV